MKFVPMLLAIILASSVFMAACSKSTQTAPTEATAAPAAASAAPQTAKTLPIPLLKLPSMTVAKGDPAAGAKVFAAQCESCHGAQGKTGGVGPALYGVGLKAGQVAYMIRKPQGVDKTSGMPKLPLSDKQVADVAAYVAALK